MAENKPAKTSSEQAQPARLGFFTPNRLFGPMIPFGDVFAMNPFALVREFTKELDRAFATSLGGESTSAMWAPALEVKETDGNFVVTAELPGIKTEDVHVEVADETLTIQGERKHEKNEEKQGTYRSERTYGRFYRSILLPEGAKTDQIEAEMNNGILQVKVPVEKAAPTTRQIPVIETEGGKGREKTAAA